jgi:GT2 family glycosyltransferase
MTKNETRVAALLTSHNRRQVTTACLAALYSQKRLDSVDLDVFLVDDASTDGTSSEVAVEFPEVELIRGTGHLFWTGGMHLAWSIALLREYDYYLWVNDDVSLAEDAVMRLLSTANELEDEGHVSIVVASFRSAATGLHTYGGVNRRRGWHRLRFEPVIPDSDHPLPCETFNGNLVLVPRQAATAVGLLDVRFRHLMGDYDYGLRASRLDIRNFIAPGYFGYCERNGRAGTWMDTSLRPLERWRLTFGPKGRPLRQWLLFARRHGGVTWPLPFLIPYAKVLLSSLLRSKRST